MSNVIELITKYSPQAWDTVYKQEAMSSFLDAPKEYVSFTGAKTVKIAKWQNGGLKDYYRNNLGDTRVPVSPDGGVDFVGAAGFGYQRSSARLVWEEFTLKADRAAAFQLEYFDNEEAGGNLIANGTTEIARTAMIPEIDAYCFSTIASYCSKALGNLVEEDITTKPLAALNAAFLYFDNNEVPVQDQIIYASPKFLNALRQTDEVTKFLGQTDFGGKDVNFQITVYQGRKIVHVSPERLRTNIQLFGQEGYSWGKDSQEINFLAVSKSAVFHVVKYEKVKIIEGDLNLAGNGFDGYTIYTRVYHDTFVLDNKRTGIYCSVATSKAEYPTVRLSIETDGAGKITDITTLPFDKLVWVVTTTEGDKKLGDVLDAGQITKLVVGSTVENSSAAVKTYAINGEYRVVGTFEIPQQNG